MKKIKIEKSKKKKKPRSGRPLEWSCCRAISLNITDGESDELFSPSRGSGSIATKRKKAGKNVLTMQGDIGLADARGKIFHDLFSLECKLGYMNVKKSDKGVVKTTWGPLDILDSTQDKTTLEQFWNQAIDDASKVGKEPLLCFQRNNRSICIVMYYDIYKKCLNLFGLPKGDVLNIDFKGHDLVILNFKFFLKWVKIKELCEKINFEKIEIGKYTKTII